MLHFLAQLVAACVLAAGLYVIVSRTFSAILWVIRRNHITHVQLLVGDITEQRADVIVNAAKTSLLGGSGVDGAIHKAGGPAILDACRALRNTSYIHGLPVGSAVETTAGDLDAKYVVHTVGPVYDEIEDRSALLRLAYISSLRRAVELGARTVAFPLISSGVYGWPVDDAVRQFVAAVRRAPVNGLREIRLVLFDDETCRIAQDVIAEG